MTKAKKLPYTPVDAGDYGTVTCMHEPYVGMTMEYDDDEDRGRIIVHADIFKPYAVLPRIWFRSATDEERAASDEAFIAKHRGNGVRAHDQRGREVKQGDEVFVEPQDFDDPQEGDAKGQWCLVELILPGNGGTIVARRAPGKGYRPLISREPNTVKTRARRTLTLVKEAPMDDETIEVPVLINGRQLGSVKLKASATEQDARIVVAADPVLGPQLAGEKKFLYVPGKVISVVVTVS